MSIFLEQLDVLELAEALPLGILLRRCKVPLYNTPIKNLVPNLYQLNQSFFLHYVRVHVD